MRTPGIALALALLALTPAAASLPPDPEDVSPFASAGAVCSTPGMPLPTAFCAAAQVYGTTRCEDGGNCWLDFAIDLQLTGGHPCASLVATERDPLSGSNRTFTIASLGDTCGNALIEDIATFHYERTFTAPYLYLLDGFTPVYDFTLCVRHQHDWGTPPDCTTWTHLAYQPYNVV